MPQFAYKGRDAQGNLRTGQRFAETQNALNNELITEGIIPIQINLVTDQRSLWQRFKDKFQNRALQFEELSVFSRQMQLLYNAGIPMVTALKQLASFTRSRPLAQALQGCVGYLEKGQSLATAMQNYPDVFPPLILSLVKLGESSGRLGEAFGHIHGYIAFEVSNSKQLKQAFRYPIFVLITIGAAILVINIFVIPNFAKFYVGMNVPLPLPTRILIGSSNLFINYGYALLGGLILLIYLIRRYLNTKSGRYRWDKLKLKLPIFGKLIRRLTLIRFAQGLAIILKSGMGITQGLELVRTIIQNSYVQEQFATAQDMIERGTSFVQSINKVELFTPIELQILSVGEQNGELGPSMEYIADFHAHEVEYDIKKMNDSIGPILIAIVSGIILIVALGVYLPIWNMVNLLKQ